MEQVIDDTLANLYYNQNKKLGAVKLLKEVNPILQQNYGIKIGTNRIQEWLNKQETVQLMKPRKKPKEFTSIKSSAPRNNYQGDFLIYDKYRYTDNQNREWRYILVVIDVYSRLIRLKPMQTKNMQEGSTKLREIFEEIGYPKNWNSDLDFNATRYLRIFREKNIKTYFSQYGETNKNAIVERANRTIRLYLQKFRLAWGHGRWVEYLDDIENLYNTSVHSTTSKRPFDVFFNGEKSEQVHKNVDYELKPGDKVRIKLQKQFMEKDDVLKYSKQIYLIHEVDGNNLTLKTRQGRILRTGNNQVKRFKPYDVQLANTIMKDNTQDPDNDNEDLEEIFQIDENATDNSEPQRRSQRIRERRTEISPIQINQFQRVQLNINDRQVTGIIQEITQNNEEKNIVRFNPERERENPSIVFKIRIPNGIVDDFYFSDFMDIFPPLNQTSRRERRRFEIGDIIQLYLQDNDGNYIRDDRTRDKKIFWGEIREIKNIAGQNQRQITINQRETNPRFVIFYFSIGQVKENVPITLFV